MRKHTRLLALIMVIAMTAMLLAGCSTSETASESTSTPAAETESTATESQTSAETEAPAESEAEAEAPAESEEFVVPSLEELYPYAEETTTLTMWTTFPYNLNGLVDDFNGIACYQEAEKRTNIHLEFRLQDQSTASEKFNLMVAAEDYTDIINSGATMYTSGRSAAVEDEVFLDLLPLIKDWAPNYYAMLYAEGNESLLKNFLTDEGYLPSINGTGAVTAAQGFVIRQDWLDELNIATPTTVDELTEALVAIKNEYDPSNTVLVDSDLNPARLFSAFEIAWGTESAVPMQVVDGEVVCSYYLDNYKKAIELMKSWNDKGLLGDFLSYTTNDQDSFILSDNAALWSGGISYMNSNYTGRSVNPNFNAVAMSDVGLEEGQAFHMGYVFDRSSGGTGWSIPVACSDVEAALKYINWYFTDEGYEITNYGVEGTTHYYDEDGNLQYTDLVFNHPDGVVSSVALVLLTNTSCPMVQAEDRLNPVFENDNMRNAFGIWLEGEHDDSMVVQGDMTADEGSAYSSKATDIATTASEVITKIIIGEADMSAFDEFLEQIKGMGIDECVEIRAAAHERYMNR